MLNDRGGHDATVEIPQGEPYIWRPGIRSVQFVHDPALYLSGVYETLSRNVVAIGSGIRRCIFRAPEHHQSQDGRHIALDIGAQPFRIQTTNESFYVDNKTHSSRYTVWTFLPRQLLAQFSKLANFYFLVVSIVQILPGVSTTGRYSTLIPLVIFVGLSMLKEGLDDWQRFRQDREENNRDAARIRALEACTEPDDTRPNPVNLWTTCKWQDISVGDVLSVKGGQAIPADVVLLRVGGLASTANIDTKMLDGETSLKSKLVCPLLARDCGEDYRLINTRAEFVVEEPNANLYHFEGKVRLGDEIMPLTQNNIIYRGSVLKNAPYILGYVVYTGQECKIRMNGVQHPRTKAPALQALVNKVIAIIACLVIALAFLNTAAYYVWRTERQGHPYYLSNAHVGFAQLLASFFLMFNPLIPLALYISLEVVKLVQVGMMSDDLEMYDEESGTSMEPRTSAITEDLGQVT